MNDLFKMLFPRKITKEEWLGEPDNSEIFFEGQKDIIDKLTVISRHWAAGKETDEVFARKLNNFINEYAQK